MRLKGILFDFDGTLVNSEVFNFDCWNETLSSFGASLVWDDYTLNNAGIPIPSNAKELIKKFSLNISPAELVERRQKVVDLRSKNYTPMLMPFAQQIVEHYHNAGLRLAIVTGSPLTDVNSFFSKVDFKKYFEFIITRDDVSESKPNPESYQLALSRLNLRKNEVIVFEDTENGVQSAVNAGLTCFAIQKETFLHHKLKSTQGIFQNLLEAKEYVDKKFEF